MYSKLKANRRVSRWDLFILQYSLTIIEKSVSYTALNKNKSIGLMLSASDGDVKSVITTATSQLYESCKTKKHTSEQDKDGNRTIIVTLEVPFLTYTLDSHTFVLGAL
jgi:hypothetical protein